MKIVDNVSYLRIGEVSEQIGRTVQTIISWYAWAEKNECLHELPEIHYLDLRKTRYFKEDEVHMLNEFKDKIKYGMMAEMNREKWGKRGKKAE